MKVPTGWNLKVEAEEFLTAVRENSDWYIQVAWRIDKPEKNEPKEKGARDTILHRLIRTEVLRVGVDRWRPEGIEVRFSAHDEDVPNIDILKEIPKIIEGFCNFLSTLPKELWQDQNFHLADLTFRAPEGVWPAVTRFCPRVLVR